LSWSRGVGQQHPTRDREGLDAGSDINRVANEILRLDDHFADVHADAHRDVLRGELALDCDGGVHRPQRAREHTHGAVTTTLDDGPAQGLVVMLDRAYVPLTFVDRDELVGLEQRRVVDHVGKHHRNELPLQTLLHPSS
jgi:hypothetical protein